MSVAIAPYVGPRAYQPGERLYGRDRESRDLADLLVADRIMLLYSPSGAGKTSIIQAALQSELLRENFRVLPIVRVRHRPPAGAALNRYVFSAALSLDPVLPDALRQPDRLSGLSLEDVLAAVERPPGTRTVLILDQFEEIFTADPAGEAERREFFRQLGEALKDPDLWALIAMREDYIAHLDPYAALLPTRLANRYRLDLLAPKAAAEAIRLPAREQDVEFELEAANKLVDNLRQVGTANGGPPRLGPDVEPVHLQIACLQLWHRLRPKWDEGDGERRIAAADVDALVDVDAALGEYYDAQLAEIARRDDPEEGLIEERRIREWIEWHLITPDGVRAQVLKDSAETRQIGDATIGLLLGAYLIRMDERRTGIWYELAHDRLVKPIRGRNAAWFMEHFSSLKSQAEHWQRSGRRSDFLFTGEALDEAKEWARAHPRRVGDTEADFLAECDKERRRRRGERRRGLILVAALGALLLLSLVFGVVTFVNKQKLEAAEGNVAQLGARAETLRGELRDKGDELSRREAEFNEREKGYRAQESYFVRREAAFVQQERDFKRRETGFIRQEQVFRQREAGFRRQEATFAARQIEFAQRSEADRLANLAAQQALSDVNAKVAAVRAQWAVIAPSIPDPIMREQIDSMVRGLAEGIVFVEALDDKQRVARDAAIGAQQLLGTVETALRDVGIIERTGAAGRALARPGNAWGLKLWAAGSTLRVRFLNGDPALHARVMAVAQEWTRDANVAFVASNDEDAEVRVAFEGTGGFSYVGTDALGVPVGQPTMLLGGLAQASEIRFRQVVLHEFGHVLGLIHEDTNPNQSIPWNVPALHAIIPPAIADREIVQRAAVTRYRPFANESVMFLLSTVDYPAQLFTAPFAIRRTDRLSDSDRRFIRELYPPDPAVRRE